MLNISKNLYLLGFLITTILLFKINTVFAQNVSFSVNSLQDLGLTYEKESDFEVERTISNAFTINLRGRNRRFFLTARSVATLNYSFVRIPTDMFYVQLTQTNADLSGQYYQRLPISYVDQTIFIFRPTNNRNFTFDYDLIFKPVGFEYEPGQYFYSIVFTLTEQ